MVIDPVCKMRVDEQKAAGTSEYKGQTYYFCAAVCQRQFEKNPTAFLG
jgi:YHS domain-containing protein